MLSVSAAPHVVDAFEAAGGRGKPRFVQLHVCWAPSTEEAEATVHRVWPQGALTGSALSDLARPKDYEGVVASIPRRAAVAHVTCGPDPARHLEAIVRFASAGFSEVYVHQIGPNQEGFFRFYADEILPHL